MRQLTLIFMACLVLVATLPATAAGPYDLRLPASLEGVDPQALSVVGGMPLEVTRGSAGADPSGLEHLSAP
jgi:hypothetical protein